jgi:hypothetical protein
MIEFSFNTGLLLIKEEKVRVELREGTGQFTLRVTAWAITIDNGTVKHRGEVYYMVVPDEEPLHRKIPVPTPGKDAKVSDIINCLRDQSYLVEEIADPLDL